MMQLWVGYKNYSSWSLRPWLLLKAKAIPFEERFFAFRHTDDLIRFAAEQQIPAQVPVLITDSLPIWDSLAIMEYLAERFPELQLWPHEPALRALARSAAAEMHSGFFALRNECPMNCREQRQVELSEATHADLQRLATLWQLFAKYQPTGDFLAGELGIVDAMYAPVMWRVRNYGLQVSPAFEHWTQAMMALPAMQEWLQGAKAEADTYVLAPYHKGNLRHSTSS